MNTAQPLRSRDEIERLKEILRSYSERDYVLFCLAINTGLRISDMLPLRVGDVRGKPSFYIRETKTRKEAIVTLNTAVQLLLREYTDQMEPDDFLFPNFRHKNQHILRVQVYKILEKARIQAGLQFPLSPHSLRKTFGWHHYQKHRDVVLLQNIFRHSSPSITLRYIGVTQDHITNSLMDFSL